MMKIANTLSSIALGIALLGVGSFRAEARPITIQHGGSGRIIIRSAPSFHRNLPTPGAIVPFDLFGTRHPYPDYYYYQTPKVNRRVIYNSTLINPIIIDSQIHNSTLVYPRAIAPHRRRNHVQRRVYIYSYPSQQRIIGW